MFYISVIFISVVGALLHFVYEWSHHNKFVALFAAVNESTWEHIKIAMTATIVWSLVDGYIMGSNPNYILAKSLCLLTIIIVIPLLFYFYTAFTKKAILVVDIICFVITVTLSQLVFKYFMGLDELPFIYTYLGAILLFVELACYAVLTYRPLKNFVFVDPITKKYGEDGHPCHHHHHD